MNRSGGEGNYEQELIETRREYPRRRLAEEARRLSKINNARAVYAIFRQWVVIALVVWFAIDTGHWAAYLLAMGVIASRQHALGLLMHEATHYHLFSNRALSDVISDLFCVFPLGITTSGYRHDHLLHHRYVNTDQDPYLVMFQNDRIWDWPKKPLAAVKILLFDLFLLNTPRNTKGMMPWTPWPYLFRSHKKPGLSLWEHVRLIAFGLALFTGLLLTNGWFYFLILWIIPMATFLAVFIRIRSVAEHLALPTKGEFSDTRHVEGTLLERLTISPVHINYHIAHHIYPSVPYYHLPKLQKLLMEDDLYREKTLNFPSYYSLRHDLIKG